MERRKCRRCGYPMTRFMDRVDRALAAYGLYCQLCEALTGKTIAKLDELLTAAQKAKRELTANKGAGLRYEAEIARLKRMAAEDILLAAQSRCPCNSCTENPIDKGCTFEECEGCDHRCVCYECNDEELCMEGREMTETPKCPYCGAEMIRTDDITTACMSSRYTCRECGSAAPQVNELDWAKFPEVSERAREAALRWAEPENRALTLEELKAHCAKGLDAEPLWAEFREECAISRWIFAVIPPDVFDRPVLSEWIATDRSEQYGKEWRCWPRKPSPEQMAAEKWEE